MDRLDFDCSCMLVVGAALAIVAGARENQGTPDAPERVTAFPPRILRAWLRTLWPLVRAAAAVGVTANTITALSLASGAGAGLCLAWGHFGIAGVLFVAASCGDALDGLVARATGSQSPSGALFDASVDRYEEFFAFGGLAMFFRSRSIVLALTLFALAGAFMVSYGSAKAEARHIAVPPGLMRRPERAVTLAVGIVLCPMAETASRSFGGPTWSRDLPVILAIVLIAVASNASAVWRLRTIALAVSTVSSHGSVERTTSVGGPRVAVPTGMNTSPQTLVHQLLASRLHVAEATIRDTDRFDELGLAPLDLVLVVARLDGLEPGDGDFPLFALEHAATVGELVDLVALWWQVDTLRSPVVQGADL
jgi:CDP-diacylglycerol--glycerol-3-phosphate 3-phosphatidyltransferase